MYLCQIVIGYRLVTIKDRNGMDLTEVPREMPGWMKHKLESDCKRNISNLRYADDTTLMAESEEELKSLLMKMKEESEKLA